MKKPPSVSVVMSVFNGERYLRVAIESVLGQSFTDFEFIINNDCSTDSSREIVESFQDDRIRLIQQENQGLVASLNRGLGEAKAPLIARMDDDDISLPTRLERQMEFLSMNVDHVLVGTVYEVIDAEGESLFIEPTLTEDEDIRLAMYVRNPIAHGSAMFRRQDAIAAGGYSEKYWVTEDYDLWRRMMKRGKIANLSQPLYSWRMNPGGISSERGSDQVENAAKIAKEMWLNHPPKLPSSFRMKHQVSFYLGVPENGGLLASSYVKINHKLALRLWKQRARWEGTVHLLRLYMSSGFALRRGLSVLYRWSKSQLRPKR